MSINDLPVLSALRTKMQWHQERQRVLSENVSNSDTPNFKPRDLVEPKFDSAGASAGVMGSLAMMRTSTSHIAPRWAMVPPRPPTDSGQPERDHPRSCSTAIRSHMERTRSS